MAIVRCKECKKDMSDKAKYCPHCGVARRDWEKIFYIVFWVLLIIHYIQVIPAFAGYSRLIAEGDCIQSCSENSKKCKSECRTKTWTWIDGLYVYEKRYNEIVQK